MKQNLKPLSFNLKNKSIQNSVHWSGINLLNLHGENFQICIVQITGKCINKTTPSFGMILSTVPQCTTTLQKIWPKKNFPLHENTFYEKVPSPILSCEETTCDCSLSTSTALTTHTLPMPLFPMIRKMINVVYFSYYKICFFLFSRGCGKETIN